MPTIPGPSIKLMVMNWLFQTPTPQIRTVGAALLLGLALAPLGCATSDGPILPKKYAISAANPHASRAGLGMLRAGGSAVDAAIAAQAVLTLVEPQSSGIGGGAFLLHYSRKAREVEAYDGRETAPAAAPAASTAWQVKTPLAPSPIPDITWKFVPKARPVLISVSSAHTSIQ